MSPAEEPVGSAPRWLVYTVLALTALAALLRFWQLGSIPPGFHVDEAFNMLDARAMLSGALRWPVFLSENAGREVLYSYLQVALMRLFGDSLTVARSASALAGTLTVPAAAWLVWQMPLAHRARVAALTAAFTAFSYWHLHFSRFGIRAGLFPLVVTLVLGLWLRRTRAADAGQGLAPSRRDKVELALLALCLGLAAYTHSAGRALALIPALDAGWRWWRGDARPFRVLVTALAGAFVVALPLTVYFAEHPWLFTSHVAEVSIAEVARRDFGGSLPRALLHHVLAVAGMFNVAGDPARWRNLPGRPVFDLVAGLFFLAGLGVALAALRRGADWARLALLWLLILAAPSVLSDAVPNFSRTIGIIPVVFLFPALGLDALIRWLERRSWPAVSVLGVLVALGVLTLTAALTTYDYFARWNTEPPSARAMDADQVGLAQFLNAAAARGNAAYLTYHGAEHATLRAASKSPPRGFDVGRGLVIPPAGTTNTEYLFLPGEVSAAADMARQLRAVPETERSTGRLGYPCPGQLPWPFAQPGEPELPAEPCPAIELTRFIAPTAALRRAFVGRAADAPDLARFGPYIRLRDATLPGTVRAGEWVTVTLAWEAIQPVDRYLNTLVHIERPDGVGIGNGDGPPLPRVDAEDSSYPTYLWRDGETIVADYNVRIDPAAPPGPADVLVGWYDPADPVQRLAVEGGGPDQRENGTVFRVGTVKVAP